MNSRRPPDQLLECFVQALAASPPAADKRHFNDDLVSLGEDALYRERWRLRTAQLYAARRSVWVVDRLVGIERELKATVSDDRTIRAPRSYASVSLRNGPEAKADVATSGGAIQAETDDETAASREVEVVSSSHGD